MCSDPSLDAGRHGGGADSAHARVAHAGRRRLRRRLDARRRRRHSGTRRGGGVLQRARGGRGGADLRGEIGDGVSDRGRGL